MRKVLVANLEQGRPTANQALLQLDFELTQARRAGAAVLKVIHGYGSTGVGGVLREAVQAALREMVTQQKVRGFVPGEDWRVSNRAAWEMQRSIPELKRDRDLGRANRGISMVLL
jgi:hypothetical protein